MQATRVEWRHGKLYLSSDHVLHASDALPQSQEVQKFSENVPSDLPFEEPVDVKNIKLHGLRGAAISTASTILNCSSYR